MQWESEPWIGQLPLLAVLQLLSLTLSCICYCWHCTSALTSGPEADSCSWNHQWVNFLHANILAVNSAIFFQPQIKIANVPTGLIAIVLSVFIAWLNLDLGIETCFYNGMDAYVITWMQFTSPLYVWALVGMIIVGSHYSGRVAKMFGRNPIAVLATLFLLSYAKLLRTVIAACTLVHIPRIP